MFTLENAKNGISTNPNNTSSGNVGTEELELILKNYATTEEVNNKIIELKTISLPQLYYNKTETDSHYSKTSHTHNTLSNDVTINGGLIIKGHHSSNNSTGYSLQLLNNTTLKDYRIAIGTALSNYNCLLMRFFNNGSNSKSNFGEIVLYGYSSGIKFMGNGNINITRPSIFEDNITVNGTINNYNLNNFSLNTHNHDDKYALINHTHENIEYKDHTHSTFNNDILINGALTLNSTINDTKTTMLKCFQPNLINGDTVAIQLGKDDQPLNCGEICYTYINHLSEENCINIGFKKLKVLTLHGNKDVEVEGNFQCASIKCSTVNDIDLSTLAKAEHQHLCTELAPVPGGTVNIGKYLDFFEENEPLNSDFTWRIIAYADELGFRHKSASWRLAVLTKEGKLTCNAFNTNSIIINGNVIDIMARNQILIDEAKENYENFTWRINSAVPNSDKPYEVRLYFDTIYYKTYDTEQTTQKRYYIQHNFDPNSNTSTSEDNINTTITHNAPINEDLVSFQIGSPVFSTGNVYSLQNGKYVNETSPTNCIPAVKTTGSYKEFIGVCVAKHESGYKATIGDLIKQDIEILQDTIDFATHGDFYFRVNNTDDYGVGDTILFDGNKLSDDLVITTKILNSIVGKVTGKIDEHLLAVFKQ